jgi:hypothetical protein
MPNVLVEAFAARLAVVISSMAHIPNMVEEGVNSFIVEPEDT